MKIHRWKDIREAARLRTEGSNNMKLMFTRPAQWADMGGHIDGLELIHADVFGPSPILRGGVQMGDSVGGVALSSRLEDMVGQFEQEQPDAFLFWAMYGDEGGDKHKLDVVVDALKRCKAASPRTVFFYGNGNQASTILEAKPDFNVAAFAPVIDVVLDNTSDERIHAIYRNSGFRTDTLHTFGFDPEDIESRAGLQANHDVFFGGSYTGRSRFPNSAFRHDLVVHMAKHFDVLVRGRGKWPSPLKRKPYVHGMDYPKEIARCKVALGCYHVDLERYYTKRTIYSLASGRPYVVRYIPDMEQDFTNGEDLYWYHDVDEAIGLVRRLVEDEHLAGVVGKNGRQVAEANHSWEARLHDMHGILERHL